MRILAIETSCDDTAIALLEESSCAIRVLASNISSQTALHNEYGGVFPAMAKREHSKNLIPVLLKTLADAGVVSTPRKSKWYQKIFKNDKSCLKRILQRERDLLEHVLSSMPLDKIPNIDLIVVTTGPGLPPTLWTGISFAKALGYLWGRKILPVDHMKGHIFSVMSDDGVNFDINKLSYPAMSLLVSGGHTEIVLMKNPNEYTKIGQTKDDAVGEAFDKVARMLGLSYPGGPEISRLAAIDRTAHPESRNLFPRPMLHSKDYDFSYSGLKTSVLYYTRKIGEIDEEQKQIIAREFEDAAIEPLIAKVKAAIDEHGTLDLIVGGGVSANVYLKMMLEKNIDAKIHLPKSGLTSDNAVMIGVAAIAALAHGATPVSYKSPTLVAKGNLSL